MSSSIEISLVVVDEHGATTRMEAVFEDTLARWPELHAEFARFSEAVHKTVFTEATPDREAGAEALAEPGFPKWHPAPKERQTSETPWHYHVETMTPDEVRRLLNNRDRLNEGLKLDKEKLISNLEQKDRDNHAAAERITELERDLSKARNELKGASKQVNQLRDNVRITQENRDIAQRKLIEVERDRDNLAARLDVARENSNRLGESLKRQEAKMHELLDKHAEQLQAAEGRYQKLAKDALEQTEALGQKLVSAVEAACDSIREDTGALSDAMIHKSDAMLHVNGILKAVAPKGAEEGKAPPF